MPDKHVPAQRARWRLHPRPMKRRGRSLCAPGRPALSAQMRIRADGGARLEPASGRAHVRRRAAHGLMERGLQAALAAGVCAGDWRPRNLTRIGRIYSARKIWYNRYIAARRTGVRPAARGGRAFDER